MRPYDDRCTALLQVGLDPWEEFQRLCELSGMKPMVNPEGSSVYLGPINFITDGAYNVFVVGCSFDDRATAFIQLGFRGALVSKSPKDDDVASDKEIVAKVQLARDLDKRPDEEKLRRAGEALIRWIWQEPVSMILYENKVVPFPGEATLHQIQAQALESKPVKLPPLGVDIDLA